MNNDSTRIESLIQIQRMNEKTMFAERLQKALIAAGYEPRPSVLEREFNLRYWGKPITFQAVRRWLRGDSIPAQDKLQVLAEWLRIEPHVLRYGDESERALYATPNELDVVSLCGDEAEMLKIYRSLPSEQRKVLRHVIATFGKANTPNDNEEMP
ncbi:transcriptional regulator [Chromohalobacter canadensis]|uniref:Transcriptional regulator n=2 Tax=Chromohalobacter canadensis TaxID=141389 RepID=A0ABZ0Y7Q8_9GAMM|nr:transcriptional regulator [Chromohalobacter canadensis]WQH08084.1 transcriptional regulator [Chromohalobacter canadensis]